MAITGHVYCVDHTKLTDVQLKPLNVNRTDGPACILPLAPAFDPKTGAPNEFDKAIRK